MHGSVAYILKYLNLPIQLIAIVIKIILPFEIFFFSFSDVLQHVEFPVQGSDLSCSCNNTGSFNPLCWARDWTCILVLQEYCQSCCATVGTPPFVTFIGQFLTSRSPHTKSSSSKNIKNSSRPPPVAVFYWDVFLPSSHKCLDIWLHYERKR